MTPLTLNWFGMAVHDVEAASDFYGNRLGLAFSENESHDAWRYFHTRRMTFELFQADPNRLNVHGWGKGQAFLPVLLVSDLSAAGKLLQDQGILFSMSTIGDKSIIEFVGPEEIRGGLMESLDAETDWAHPLIAGIGLKASNIKAQRDFYTRVLGMTVQHETDQVVHLSQSSGEAWLQIVSGGVSSQPPRDADKPAFFYPIWISYETDNVRDAGHWLQEQNVMILHPLTYHADWLGTDIIIADTDGNAIQVVQYGRKDVD